MTSEERPIVMVGESQGQVITFASHPVSKKLRKSPYVPKVAIEAGDAAGEGPPFDYEDAFWKQRVKIVCEMLGFPDGAELRFPSRRK